MVECSYNRMRGEFYMESYIFRCTFVAGRRKFYFDVEVNENIKNAYERDGELNIIIDEDSVDRIIEDVIFTYNQKYDDSFCVDDYIWGPCCIKETDGYLLKEKENVEVLSQNYGWYPDVLYPERGIK